MQKSITFILLVWLFSSCAGDEKKSGILSPAAAISDFKLEEGFSIECVAAEPIVEDPVAIAFDRENKMYVVEMRSYMPDADGIGENTPLSRIKILEDKDNNGSYESMAVFLDSLVLPRAICPVYNGVLVAVPPYLYFYDKSGKNKTIVDSTYADGGNVEHQANGLLPGLDNWIYSAKSDRRYQRKEGKWIMQKTVFRGQWGIDQDMYGRLYYHHNSAVAQGDFWQPTYLPLQALAFDEGLKKSFGKNLVDNKVYPRVPTYVNRGYEEHVLTAEGKLASATGACGLSVYDGHQFPHPYQGNIFSPEPCGQLIKRVVLSHNGESVRATLPYVGKEFLTASDPRFRPVFTTTGPDGALYVVDMHRGLIQHSTYLTNYLRKIVKDNNLDQPIHMGRIYRITYNPSDKKLQSKKIGNDAKALVKLLGHPNKWHRIQAQWALISHKELSSVIIDLHQIISQSASDAAKLHAAWILHYSNEIKKEDLKHLLLSKNQELHKAAIHFSSQLALEDFKNFIYPSNRTNTLIYLSAACKYLKQDYNAAQPLIAGLCSKYATDTSYAAVLAGGIIENTNISPRNAITATLKKAAHNYKIIQWINETNDKQEKNLKHMVHFTASEKELFNEGEGNYKKFCASCHGMDGKGIATIGPPLDHSEWVIHDDISIPVSILLNGKKGPISVAGKDYNFNAPMPSLRDNQAINDGTIAKILTYIRNAWGNSASPVHTEHVSKIRVKPAIILPDKVLLNQKKKILKSKANSHKRVNENSLFNGRDLINWHTLGGKATYKLEGKAIVGITSLNTTNTFLVSNKAYADFEMEVDVWIDTLLNSGIQIRSNRYPNYNNGAFHGYQIEIDPSPRAWSGGLYDESRRGWLYKPENNREAQAAFKKNKWNHYKIQAIGKNIKTWINGTVITDYKDDRTRSGYIGLQVHSIGDEMHKNNRIVKWKNITFNNLGNTLWQASEEDAMNTMSNVYDEDQSTSWQGQSLKLDFQKRIAPQFELVANFPITIRYSKDGKRWQSKTISEIINRLPPCRYVVLEKQSEKLILHNIKFYN